MIDDKKIEEACDKALKNSVFNNNVHAYPYVRGFYDCAKWAFNEFRKDLWHPNTEKPKEDSNIVYIDENDEFWDIDNYNSDNFDDSFGKGWDSACRTQNIYKWCYKEDLLSKEGGQQ